MKPGVLRYGPPPNESTHTGQSPIRPNVSMAQGGPPGTPESTHNSIYQSQQGLLLESVIQERIKLKKTVIFRHSTQQISEFL